MSTATPSSEIEQILLAGPRGGRLLLEYALASEHTRNPVRDEGTLGYAVVLASSSLDPGKGSTGALFDWGAAKAELPEVTASQVAERLQAAELLEPTAEFLRNAVAAAVDSARYWQEPDGMDVLAATPELHTALSRIAEHVASSPMAAWWCTSVALAGQQSVQWDEAPPKPVLVDGRGALRAARDRARVAEQAAREDRLAHPHANWSAEWWSRPPQDVPSSTRSLCDGAPAGLWFVEDSLGWDRADSVSLIVPGGLRVFEIRGAAEWAELCARFPLEVTAQKRDDWYRSTGRAARWVVPDWAQVAEHYDAVHLQVGAYLAAAGIAIPVNDGSDAASVIAGWNPDETYWFTPDIAYGKEHARWVLEEHGTDMVWAPDRHNAP